jgi:hypothetical protein
MHCVNSNNYDSHNVLAFVLLEFITNVTLHATMMNNAGECRRLELDGGGQ